jgi:hypothetical protein
VRETPFRLQYSPASPLCPQCPVGCVACNQRDIGGTSPCERTVRTGSLLVRRFLPGMIDGMQKGVWASSKELARRSENADVIRASVLESFGMERSTIYRRCLPGGPWRRVLPGIILLTPTLPTDQQKIRAALLRGGRPTLITGLWAAHLHGLRRTPKSESVHILVPDTRKVLSSGFVLVERTTRFPDGLVKNGVPLAPVTRAVLDAARRMTKPDDVRALLAEAVQRGFCDPATLSDELEHGSDRGSALPRRILTEISGGARSVAEISALQLWRKTRLPACRWNVEVMTDDGNRIARPDAWWDDVALAWEIDSKEFHFTPDGYAATLRRNNRYAAAGVVVVQTIPSALRDDPAGVIRELKAAYAVASQRPRPALTYR